MDEIILLQLSVQKKAGGNNKSELPKKSQSNVVHKAGPEAMLLKKRQVSEVTGVPATLREDEAANLAALEDSYVLTWNILKLILWNAGRFKVKNQRIIFRVGDDRPWPKHGPK